MTTGTATIEIDCPECDGRTWAEIEFLIGSGFVPRSFIGCDHCGKELAVTADLSVDVSLAAEV